MEADFEAQRQAMLEALVAFARGSQAVAGLWLQGSLARGDADPLSDIDAYLAVEDPAFETTIAGREALLRSLGELWIWSDAVIPGTTCVHGLFAGGVRLDLFVERLSKVGERARPPFTVLVDRASLASRLRAGWTADAGFVGRAMGRIVRMTRQGALWPLRVLARGDWSTLAMVELDLVNAQLAQLMAVRTDPALFHQHPFALPRRLSQDDRVMLAELSAQAMNAIQNRDRERLLAVHLSIYDALVREGRAACERLGVTYPVEEALDAAIRALVAASWPDETHS
jgi:predicted nucleotidyltransferase